MTEGIGTVSKSEQDSLPQSIENSIYSFFF